LNKFKLFSFRPLTRQGAIPAIILRPLRLFNDIATVTADDIRDTPADFNPVAER
jgi:hypothetical protein